MLYIAKRTLLCLPVMLVVTVLVFLLMRVIPGDPALLILAGSGEGSVKQEDLDNLRRELGTDRPLHIQYGTWIWGLVRGDFGTSLFYRTPIIREIGPRIPATLELAFLAVIISFILAVPLGVLSAVKQDRWLDCSRLPASACPSSSSA